MYNKKLLITTLKNLDKTKAPAKKKDIDYNSKMGYRKDSPFRKKASMDIYTENGTIDMSETDRDILANGRVLPAYSGLHQFDTNVVNEIPLEEAKYGRSGNLNATNRLLIKNPLMKKNPLLKKNPFYKKKNYKRKIYDPQAMYFDEGGTKEPCPLGYIWNGIECVPNPFETRPSQRAAIYIDKEGNYQIDPVYQQYSQQQFDVSESNKKAQDFNKMYAQSKNYKRLLKKQGYTPEEIKDRINSVTNINDFRYIDEGLSYVDSDKNTGKEFISYNVTDPGDWPGFDQIAAHEWGHVGIGINDPAVIPLKEKESKEFINRINKEKAGITGNPDDLEHDMDPQENRADLVQLRQQLQEAGVFDSTKRKKFKKKDLNEYKKIMESSEKNWNNMWNRMFRLYDDDAIIYFMNNIAKNDSDDNLQVAKYGIELELTPEEIDEYRKGGYIVEDISIPSLTKFAPGGANKGCPPGQYWNGKKCTKLITLKDDKKYIDGVANWGMHVSDPNMVSGDYNDQIKNRLYSGKWGLDPESGALVNLSAIQPQSVTTLDAKTKASREKEKLKEQHHYAEEENKKAYDKSITDAGFDPATFGKAKGVNTITGEPIYASSKEEADRINQEAINQAAIEGHAAVVNNPVFKAAAYMTPVGMGIGAMEGLARFIPDAATFAQDPNLANAGQLGMDVAQVLPFAKPIATATGKAFNYVKNLEPAAPGPMMLMGRFADDVAKTGDDVAKVVSKAETPKSNFKSEIDWDKWNPEISKNQELLQEYHAIEEAAKADGTWMKNPDGSPFVLPDGKAGQHWTFTKGTPEQFVQMQSQNFKKAYPEGFDAWYTGRMKDPTEQFPLFAELYPEGRSIFGGDYHVATRYASTQPEGYDTFKRITTEFKPKEITRFTDADQTAKVHGLISPKTSNSFLFNARKQGWREIPVGSDTGITPMWEGQPIENFRENLKTTFKNPKTGIDETGYKVKTDDIAEHLEKNNMDYATIEDVVDGSVADYVRIHNLKSGNYPKSLWGNNGMFDLSNPNIYKAIIPTAGVTGLTGMMMNNSNGLQQQQYGGGLDKFIRGGSPCDEGYTYDPKLGCIPLTEESMTEAQQWMTNWYKNRKIEFPEDQKGFKKANEKLLPFYNPESPMFKQMESFPVYEPIPEEYMEKDPGGYAPAGMYDGEGKVPTIYFSPNLNDEQKTDTEIHELTNHFMRRSKELYPMYDRIVKENIIPFDKTWPKEKQQYYDYIINPEEQNIQSYLNVARKKFNLKPDEVVTPERLNKMREEAEKKGLLEEGGKNFNPDIFLLFRTAKDDESLMRLFNLIAKNDSNKDEIQYGQYGGTLELGDEVELTKKQVAELKKYGYTLEQI